MDPVTAVDAQLESFALLVESSPHNLVSRRARDELRSRHVPECVSLARMLPSGPQRVLDVGSGGGFPGMVLAIVRPELDVHLLDSTEKKTGFLEGAGRQLGIAVTVHHGRAEALARPPLANSFDIVTARAVAPLDRLVRWTIPYLRVGGLLYAVKGERWREEVEAASAELRRWGARVVVTPEEIGDQASEATAPRVVMIARDR